MNFGRQPTLSRQWIRYSETRFHLHPLDIIRWRHSQSSYQAASVLSVEVILPSALFQKDAGNPHPPHTRTLPDSSSTLQSVVRLSVLWLYEYHHHHASGWQYNDLLSHHKSNLHWCNWESPNPYRSLGMFLSSLLFIISKLQHLRHSRKVELILNL